MDPSASAPPVKDAGWNVELVNADRTVSVVRVTAYGDRGPVASWLAEAVTLERVSHVGKIGCSECGREAGVFTVGHDPRACRQAQSGLRGGLVVSVRQARTAKALRIPKKLPKRKKGERRTAWRARNGLL